MTRRTLIEITETRAISADPMNWMAMRRNKKTDKAGKPVGGYTEWAPYSYHATFEQVAAHIEREMIRTCGASTLTELRRSAKQIHEQIKEVLQEGKLL